MEHFSAGWNIVKENLVGWIIFSLVWGITASFGVGILLLPNVYRAVRDAINSNSAPEIGALFNFDNITEDAIGMIIFAVAQFVGSIALGIGALVAGVLFFWIPPLLAENRVAGAESWKASLAHSKGNFVDILVFGLVAGVVNFAGALLCGLGTIVTLPVTLAASWLFYSQNRDEIAQLSAQEGLQLQG
jgi:uncharacterized membrane protein